MPSATSGRTLPIRDETTDTVSAPNGPSPTSHGLGDRKSGEPGRVVTVRRGKNSGRAFPGRQEAVMSLASAMLTAMTGPQLPSSDRFAGITTTAELFAAGLSSAMIGPLVRHGELTPVCREVCARAELAAAATRISSPPQAGRLG